MYKHNDLRGARFGNLEVISENGRSKDRHIMWLCRCDCGNEITTIGRDLINGHTQSCGCRQKKSVSSVSKIHGDRDARLYRVWQSMKKRCENANCKGYKYYGGVGIIVCPEWHDYRTFKHWAIENGYDEAAPFGKCTIDRIDPYGNYEPSNCRWVGMDVQAKNKRKSAKGTNNG